jgi:hypothetical protein
MDGAGTGGLDVFVSKFDANGTKIWTKQSGTTLNDAGKSVAVDNTGNVYVTGMSSDTDADHTKSVMFLIKYTGSGVQEWIKQIGSGYGTYGTGVGVDNRGDIIVTGYNMFGSFDGNSQSGNVDYFIVKYNASGTKLWSRQAGSTNVDLAYSIAVDSTTNNIYVAGTTHGSMDGNTITSLDRPDMFLVKYRTDGVRQWTKELGTIADDYGYSVSVDPAGNVYVTGSTAGDDFDGHSSFGGKDVYLIKYTATGVKLWSGRYGTDSDDSGRSVTADIYGNVYITGNTSGNFENANQGSSDVMLIKCDAGSGTKMWAKQFGTSDGDEAYGIDVDTTGAVYLAGHTPGKIGDNNVLGSIDVFLTTYIYDTIPPLAITNLSARGINPGEISLQWAAPADNYGFTNTYSGCKYRIKYSSNPASILAWSTTDYSIEFSTDIIAHRNVEQSVRQLTHQTTFYFCVWAIDQSSNVGPLSNVATGWVLRDNTPPAGAPVMDKFFMSETSSSAVVMQWKIGTAIDPESGISGFNVQISTLSSMYATILDTNVYVYDPDTSFVYSSTISGCTDGVRYYARVRGINSVDLFSVWSATVSVAYDLSAPSSAPAISSFSHPDPDKGYSNPNPLFVVTGPDDISGIAGYYYVFDQVAVTIPSVSASTFVPSTAYAGAAIISVTDVNDGTWYLHVVAKDNAGHVSAVTGHYKIQVRAFINPATDNTFESDNTTVLIPAGAVSNSTKLIITVPVTAVVPTVPAVKNVKQTGVFKDVSLFDGTKTFAKPVTVTITYANADITGLDESKLKLFMYSTDTNQWELVSSDVDQTQNKVSGTVTHFCVFGIMEYSIPGEDTLENLSSYPNPVSPLKNQVSKIVYVLKQAGDTKLELFDLTGGLVWSRTIISGDPGAKQGLNTVFWDGKNDAGIYVESGVYILKVQSGDKSYKWKLGVK